MSSRSSSPAPYKLAKELTVESLEAGLSARVHGRAVPPTLTPPDP
jgi:hypothetical protein